MLQIKIPAIEKYDEENNEFLEETKEQTLQLEHSLVSLSKWESKWQKPFLSKEIKTHEETIDYIRCMTITQNVDPSVYKYINNMLIKEINEYIENPMTATTFSNKHGKVNREVVTAEIIYYWMVSFNIPFECQKWHLNRLLTLVNVCNLKNQPQRKMTRKELLARNHALNKARRANLNSGG